MSRVALALYRVAHGTGLLRTRLGDALFVRSYFLYKRLIEDPFAELVRRAPELFSSGDVLDVGANIGYTASVFARAISPGFRVHAFEPQPENFERLQRTIARLNLGDRVECFQWAVGGHDGSALLWNNENHHGDHRIVTETFARNGDTVSMTTLDTFVAAHGRRPIAFVKIDVQGFEPAVLAGMTQLIGENPAVVIAAELAPEQLRELGFSIGEATEPLVNAGFTPHLLTEGALRSMSVADILAVTDARGYVDVIWMRKE